MTTDGMVGHVQENREPGSVVLYTVGYEGRSPEEFCALLRSRGIMRLIDVRQTPSSRKAGFSLRSLSQHLETHGIEYVHLGELGSPKEARVELHRTGDFESFSAAYLRHVSGAREHLDRLVELAADKPTAIMCFEKDVSRCHRGILASRIGHSGFEIRDL